MKRRLWLLKFQRCLLSSLLVTTLYNDVDGIPTCLTPRQIVDSTQNSCVIVFASNSCEVEKHSQSDTVIDVLSRSAFKDEPGVKIGKITLANFRWPNFQSIKLSTGEAIVGDVLLFPKHKPDRTCLLTDKSQSQSPTPVLYSGVKNVDNIVEFINFHCNKYRTSTGSLNVAGLHRQNILESIFSVSSVSDVKSKDVFGKSLSKSCLIASKAQSDECNFTKSQKYQSNLAKDNQKEMKKCDRIPVPRKEEFFHQYLKISKPVVIQNAIGHWDVFTKWSNEYLHQLYGENSVHVKLTPGGEFEGVERASLWEDYETFKIPSKVKEQLQYPDLVVVRPATANVKFSEFLELVEKVSKGVVRNVSAYLEYSSIPEHLPDLEKDIQELAFMEGLLKRAHLNIWLSDGNTLGKLHFDPFDNLLCQISGRKEVILFEPHNNHMLYEGHIPEAKLSYNHTSRSFSRRSRLDSTSMVMSPVDISKPDFKRFSLFADTYPLNCTIDEGDVLFMPSFWWHEVQSYPNTDVGRNLAVNFWYEPFLTKEFPCPECRLDINQKYKHLL